MSYFVYMLECADGTLYSGITTDVSRRLVEHQSGKGARYTRVHGALRMVYVEPQRDRSSASKREAALKRMSRSQKEELISLKRKE